MKASLFLFFAIVNLVFPACSDFTTSQLCNSAWSCYYSVSSCLPSSCYASFPGLTGQTCPNNCASVQKQIDNTLIGSMCYNASQHTLPSQSNQYYCSEYFGLFGECTTLSGCQMYMGECFSESIIPTTCGTLCNSCGNADDCNRKTDCYYNSGTCYNKTVCRSNECSSCLTQGSCTGKDTHCRWNGDSCYDDRTSCSSSGDNADCASCPTSASCAGSGNTNCYYTTACYDSRISCEGSTTCSACSDADCAKRNDCHYDEDAANNKCTELSCTGSRCADCGYSAACYEFGAGNECFWDSNKRQCFNNSCTALTCDSCHTQQTCEGTSGCFWRFNDDSCRNSSVECEDSLCSSCTTTAACDLVGWCYSYSTSCYDANTSCGDGSTSCSSCNHTACDRRSDACIWNEANSECHEKICVWEECGACMNPSSCSAFGDCYWDTADSRCYENQCDQTGGNGCDACHSSVSCATRTSCEWMNTFCYNSSLVCGFQEGCGFCQDSIVCNKVIGCQWADSVSRCKNTTCTDVSCGSCELQSSCTQRTGCEWDSPHDYCSESLPDRSMFLAPPRLLLLIAYFAVVFLAVLRA